MSALFSPALQRVMEEAAIAVYRVELDEWAYNGITAAAMKLARHPEIGPLLDTLTTDDVKALRRLSVLVEKAWWERDMAQGLGRRAMQAQP